MGELTREQVHEIRERADAATEGPWHTGGFLYIDGTTRQNIWGPRQQADHQSGPQIAEFVLSINAGFMAAARTDVPDLCDTVEALREQVERLTRERDEASAAWREEIKKRSEKPDFQTFLDLKYGPFGMILSALQDGRISKGKAAEALAELAHGVEPQLPSDLPEPLEWDAVPSTLLSEATRRAEAAEAEAKRLREWLGLIESDLNKITKQEQGITANIDWLLEAALAAEQKEQA